LLALLQRVAAQTKTGALVLSRLLGVGCIVEVISLLATHYGVPIVGICVSAICGLLILGGLWVLLEPGFGAHTRKRRLGAIGAMAITVAFLLMFAGPPAALRSSDEASDRAGSPIVPQGPPTQGSASRTATDSS